MCWVEIGLTLFVFWLVVGCVLWLWAARGDDAFISTVHCDCRTDAVCRFSNHKEKAGGQRQQSHPGITPGLSFVMLGAIDFAAKLKRYDAARKSLQEKDEAEKLRREQQREARIRDSLSKGSDHFVMSNGVPGSNMNIREPDDLVRARPKTAAAPSAVSTSHFEPASTVLTRECHPAKLENRPMHVQDDQWMRMRGHRRHVVPEHVVPAHEPGAAGIARPKASQLLRPKTAIEPRPYAHDPLTDGLHRPFLNPAAAEKQSRAALVGTQPLDIEKSDPPHWQSDGKEAWREGGRRPLQLRQAPLPPPPQQQQRRPGSPPPRGVSKAAPEPEDIADDADDDDDADGEYGGVYARGLDPHDVCERLYPDVCRVVPPPPAAQRIATLSVLVRALESVGSAVAMRVCQVASWELEMLHKGRSERAMQGLRTTLPSLVLQFVRSRPER